MKPVAYDKMIEFEDSHFWFVAREQICLDLIDGIMKESVKRILDYGCGTGKIAYLLQQRYQDKEIFGADVSDAALDYCRKRGLTNIFDLKNEKLPQNTFDLIICFEVLEHIEDEMEFLAQVKELLRTGGMIFMTVPAYDFLWSGEDYVSNHVRRYTRKQIKQKIGQAGFRTSKVSYFNTFLFLPIVLVLLAKRIFLPQSMYESDFKEVPRFLNMVLAKIFASEKWFLKHVSFPFGASLLVIAQKEYLGKSRSVQSEARPGSRNLQCLVKKAIE
jgi:trans-aconitate methyltransferase